MKSIADQLPPDIARQLHPDRRKNEQAYWAVRNQLLHQYHGQWIAFTDGRVVASGTSPVTVFHAGEATGLHPFFICVGNEEQPTRILLHADEFACLNQPEYDDSPWPREGLHALAWEAGRLAGWEDMDEYNDLPDKP